MAGFAMFRRPRGQRGDAAGPKLARPQQLFVQCRRALNEFIWWEPLEDPSPGRIAHLVTAAFLRRWPVGRPLALHLEAAAITLDVILRAVLGMEPGPELDTMRTALVELLRRNTTMFSSEVVAVSVISIAGPRPPPASVLKNCSPSLGLLISRNCWLPSALENA